jgi:ABC-2 type transport system ATP-binding protein
VSEIIETCAIRDVETKIIGQLSKGYRQRVGLADALIADPRILVLDEPLASLDPNQQTQAKKLIMALKQKHTIILSTHILADVEEICDRMVIIDRGKLIASGTPDELAQRFQEENHLRVEIVGPKDEVKRAVEGIQGVKSVETAEHDGVVVLRIRTESDMDIREKLSQTVVASNWGLREMRSERMELAEIFGRLTQAG